MPNEPNAYIEGLFSSWPLDGEQAAKVAALRAEAKAFADAIERLSPSCADTTFAIRQVRSALHFAIAAIAIPK
jgi:hypothetical protein